ncbi:uncharacterized protein SPPG_09359 [Spizellomyces punctatus DAOM BR117]|uniref:Uncharacterized protein n=1 Tax=Spizellomyces punctatus (strain DAOM BR117) TaxID=645134 RepID=A0A0L0HCS6_SPIPD|nr:uncharacterized protein SPPG_09359 [Spizellomyces punctatus DAOM BR117]KNC98538.1 hypothetical protein SPPG_09359 [Spizellomyces punctatus DAOM BR117]|eukprot:XP_016606578.1 hypothetical protein SPPG_09359 [Spizellomyces punctatus DAOM BR117]
MDRVAGSVKVWIPGSLNDVFPSRGFPSDISRHLIDQDRIANLDRDLEWFYRRLPYCQKQEAIKDCTVFSNRQESHVAFGNSSRWNNAKLLRRALVEEQLMKRLPSAVLIACELPVKLDCLHQ